MDRQKAIDRANRRPRDVTYDRELEWFLQESPSVMGERSAFDGLVAAIERGANSGNKGTKGCGRVIHFPYGDLDLGYGVAGAGLIRRCRVCRITWGLLDTWPRNVAVARYLFEAGKLPQGMHGALGDVAGVAIVVAQHFGTLDRLADDARHQRWSFWSDPKADGARAIAGELVAAHRAWFAAKVRVAKGDECVSC